MGAEFLGTTGITVPVVEPTNAKYKIPLFSNGYVQANCGTCGTKNKQYVGLTPKFVCSKCGAKNVGKHSLMNDY